MQVAVRTLNACVAVTGCQNEASGAAPPGSFNARVAVKGYQNGAFGVAPPGSQDWTKAWPAPVHAVNARVAVTGH